MDEIVGHVQRQAVPQRPDLLVARLVLAVTVYGSKLSYHLDLRNLEDRLYQKIASGLMREDLTFQG